MALIVDSGVPIDFRAAPALVPLTHEAGAMLMVSATWTQMQLESEAEPSRSPPRPSTPCLEEVGVIGGQACESLCATDHLAS